MSSYSRSAGEGEATIIRCSVPVVWRRGAAAEILALDHTGIVVRLFVARHSEMYRIYLIGKDISRKSNFAG